MPELIGADHAQAEHGLGNGLVPPTASQFAALLHHMPIAVFDFTGVEASPMNDATTKQARCIFRPHHGRPQGAKPKAEVIANILADIKERRA